MTTKVDGLNVAQLDDAQALLDRACLYDDVTGLATEKLFGPGANGLVAEPLGAFQKGKLVAVACTSGPWLRLLAVDPEFREQGVGSALLLRCEAQIACHADYARTLDQPGNYLSPGIDLKNQTAIDWLSKRGYAPCGKACNLLIEVQDNVRISAERMAEMLYRCETQGYDIERMSAEKLENAADIVGRTFSEGWKFEMTRATQVSGGVHIAIARDTGEFAGFAVHDGNNAGRGWFGPTGTLPSHRGRGLGAAALMACLLDVRAAGHSHCQVAWIGPREFYDKIAGIDGERNFTVLRKEVL